MQRFIDTAFRTSPFLSSSAVDDDDDDVEVPLNSNHPSLPPELPAELELPNCPLTSSFINAGPRHQEARRLAPAAAGSGCSSGSSSDTIGSDINNRRGRSLRRHVPKLTALLVVALATLLVVGRYWVGQLEAFKDEVPADRLDRFHYRRQRYLMANSKSHDEKQEEEDSSSSSNNNKNKDNSNNKDNKDKNEKDKHDAVKDHVESPGAFYLAPNVGKKGNGTTGGLEFDPSSGYSDLMKRASDWAAELTSTGRMRQASVYLHYAIPWTSAPAGSSSVAWFHKLVPKRSADDTYFAVQGTHVGYFGLQQIRDFPRFEGKVIFSIWDDEGSNSAAKVFECGDNTVCTRFSGEGTGAKAYIHFADWELDRPYYFMTTAQQSPTSAHHAIYSGYFHAAELGGWVLVARIEAYVGGKGWQINHPYSFTEQWTARDYDSERWQLLGPSFMQFGDGKNPVAGSTEKGWEQVRQAAFSHTTANGENTMTSSGNVTGDQWGLGMGGASPMTTNGVTLVVGNDVSFPSTMTSFTDMEAADRPGGCMGGTCTMRLIIGSINEAFSAQYLPVTIIVMIMLLIVLGLVALVSVSCCLG